MFQPKRIKYRKMHRGRRRGTAQTGNQVAFGDYGLEGHFHRLGYLQAD